MIKENQRLIRTREDDDELTCIVCPIGCRMKIARPDGGEVEVSGNKCKRGANYALQEFQDPRRVVTGTCAVSNSPNSRLPVRSSEGVPVHSVAAFLAAMYRLRPAAPVTRGDTIATDLAGTGVDLRATMTVEATHE